MRPLDIVVCIKPVPDPKRWDKLKLDPETMLLCRGDIPPVINPLDRNAIEQANSIRTQAGGSVSVVTMAPPDAVEQLSEALAMGCDRAFLLSDPAFAGADTLATARCLAAAVRKMGSFDLILCGGFSLDGSTSQVGPQLAELLDIPDVTHATRLELTAEGIRASCKLSEASAVYETDLPALVTLSHEANTPRLPTMTGIMRASGIPIVAWTARDLELAPETVGLEGSPTRMLNIFSPPVRRKGEILQGSPEELAAKIADRLRDERILKAEVQYE